MVKKISLNVLVTLYIVAGINHFVHPAPYLTIIPPYFPQPVLINIAAGVLEIVLAILVAFPATRKWGAMGIVALLIAFIPAHIYMIQKQGCMGPDICVASWIAWVRLFPMQFILIAWAWWHRR